MPRRKKVAEQPNKALDTFSAKRARGRPPRMRFSEIGGRADHFRWILNEVWDRLWPLLSKAQNEEDVIRAFQEGASPYTQNFMPGLAALTFTVMREPRFRKRRQPQINFLADSLAGLSVVTPRRSRDICAQERVKEKRAQRAHHIIRYEFYVECSCGYKGRSWDHACPKCGGKITFGLSPVLGLNPFTG